MRESALTEADLELLDRYRRSFGDVYDHVAGTIRGKLSLAPTGRSAKSTASVIEKLRRESIRLSQMQDLAGCRIVVNDLEEQDKAVAAVREAFADAVEIDRRSKPSHGYRAVHVVVREAGRAVEIQIRTKLQHLWAEFSEKVADSVDPRLKYGEGPPWLQQQLLHFSALFAQVESASDEELWAREGKRRSEIIELLERELAAILPAILKLGMGD